MRAPIFLLAATCLASPALADHAGPSGVGGGTLNVLSPDTLDEGAFAIGLRVSYLRPDQRPDATLAALAAQHVHAHNTDYNLNSSLGVAYGATHELTLSLELPYIRRDGLREGTHSHVAGQAVNGVEQLGSVAGIGDANFLPATSSRAKPRSPLPSLRGSSSPREARISAAMKVSASSSASAGNRELRPHRRRSVRHPSGAARLTASGLYQISGKGAAHSLGQSRTGRGRAVAPLRAARASPRRSR